MLLLEIVFTIFEWLSLGVSGILTIIEELCEEPIAEGGAFPFPDVVDITIIVFSGSDTALSGKVSVLDWYHNNEYGNAINREPLCTAYLGYCNTYFLYPVKKFQNSNTNYN